MAAAKKRRVTAAELQPLEGDHAEVAALLQMPNFQPMPFLTTFPSKDALKEYLKALEMSKRTIEAYAELTMDRIPRFVLLKEQAEHVQTRFRAVEQHMKEIIMTCLEPMEKGAWLSTVRTIANN